MNTIARGRSPLEVGVLVTLAAFGIAGTLGLVAVIDADSAGSAAGTGFGVAWAIGIAGATVAAALACLRRGRLELVALGAVIATGIAIDLLALAVLADIDSEAYVKVTGVAFVWSLFALVILGLSLSVGVATGLGRLLHLATIAVAVLAVLVATWLIATAGAETPITYFFDIGPEESDDDGGMLRVLGGCFVVLAALWFATLAATRLERPVSATD